MKKIQIKAFIVFAMLFVCGVCFSTAKAQCRDPWINEVVVEERVSRAALPVFYNRVKELKVRLADSRRFTFKTKSRVQHNLNLTNGVKIK